MESELNEKKLMNNNAKALKIKNELFFAVVNLRADRQEDRGRGWPIS